MLDKVQQSLAQIRARGDFREHVREVTAADLQGDRLVLHGRVLNPSDRAAVTQALQKDFPDLKVDDSQLEELHKSDCRWMAVATNYTTLHRETSFMSELYTGMVYGWRMQVLEEKENWAFVRLEDGYLGWTYLPYLGTGDLPEPTHIVRSPVVRLRSAPGRGKKSEIISRVLGGTKIRLLDFDGKWARIEAAQTGWVRAGDLRALSDQPEDEDELRAQMVADAARYMGVPYLWGGTTANGIDCSGLAQLVHRLSGITIRRDADMQKVSGTPVEYPFRPGDLVFYGEDGGKGHITHVSVSLGGWEIIHSSRSRNGVYWDDIQKVEHLRDSFAGGVTYIS